MSKFNFKSTPVAKMAEEIRDDDNKNVQLEQTPQEEEQQQVSVAPIVKPEENSVSKRKVESETTKPMSTVKAKKATNGIVIDVPMEDYMQLTMLKIQTGQTLKEMALQAIHEFVERNKIG